MIILRLGFVKLKGGTFPKGTPLPLKIKIKMLIALNAFFAFIELLAFIALIRKHGGRENLMVIPGIKNAG